MSAAQRIPSILSRASSSPSYVCRSCRSKLLSSTKANASQLRHASNHNLPWTEKVRRKIWGTDNPPGLADPYGGPSFLEKRKMDRERRANARVEDDDDEAGMEAAMKELEQEERERDAQQQLQASSGSRDVLRKDVIDGKGEEVGPTEYKPAKTWDGLIHVGHTGHWGDVEPGVEDHYMPWFVNEDGSHEPIVPRTREETEDVLQQAASEAGLSLSSEQLSHQKLDFRNPITFQIFKNFNRISGLQLRDSALNILARDPNNTYASVVDLWVKDINEPMPENLYQTLAANEQLVRQSNVMVLPRRETPIDKEKEVGRWKVIEKELKERGLPVVGRVEI